MTLAGVQLALLTVTLFVAIAAVITATLRRQVRAAFRQVAPAARARVVTAALASPALAGVLLTVICFAPSILQRDADVHHCTDHAGHAHLCFEHVPATSGGAIGWCIVAAAAAYVGAAGVPIVRRVGRARVGARLARGAAIRVGESDVWEIDHRTPLAAAVGLRKPRVLLTSALRKALPADSLNCVVAHERAHARRLDALRILIGSALSILHFPRVREDLLSELRLACEQACDASAAAAVGNPWLVADAIVRCERLMADRAGRPATAAVAFSESHTAERVAALLSESRRDSRWRAWSLYLAPLALIVAAGAFAHDLHHLVETLIGPLFG